MLDLQGSYPIDVFNESSWCKWAGHMLAGPVGNWGAAADTAGWVPFTADCHQDVVLLS